MKNKGLWRALFERFEVGDRVMVRYNSPWVYKGMKGKIVKIQDKDGERYYLLEINRRALSSLEVRFLKKRHYLNGARKINQVGWFRGKHLVFIR